MSTTLTPTPARATAAAPAAAVLALACVAQFMLLVDDTITNVALPTIGAELAMSESSLSWVVNAYLLTFGGFLLVGGRLADRFGGRRMFTLALAGFAVASALCGLAPSDEVLVAARAGQGVMGALLSPAALSILLATHPEGPARRRALSVWAGLMGLGAATGLVAGGALVEVADWRWIFLVNLPVALLALAAVPRVLPADRGADRRAAPNVTGATLGTLSLLLLVFTVVETDGAGWTSARTLLGLAGAAALLAAFVRSERRSASPLVPAELLRRPQAMAADVTVFLAAGGLLAMFFFQTLYLQRVLGFEPLETGLSFLPFSAAMGVASGLAAKLGDRVDPRVPIAGGLVLAAFGLWLMSTLTPASAYTDVLWTLLVTGASLGTVFVPVMSLATGGAEERDGGLASGLMTTAQQIGGAIGIAVMTTIATTTTSDALAGGAAGPQAMTAGFSAAFAVQAAVMLAAAAFALVALRPRRA